MHTDSKQDPMHNDPVHIQIHVYRKLYSPYFSSGRGGARSPVSCVVVAEPRLAGSVGSGVQDRSQPAPTIPELAEERVPAQQIVDL